MTQTDTLQTEHNSLHKKKLHKKQEAADTTARNVSRLLKKHKFQMANRSTKKWTEGLYVHRIGVGKTVHVGYHRADHGSSYQKSQNVSAILKRVRQFLVEHDYVLDPEANGIHLPCNWAGYT